MDETVRLTHTATVGDDGRRSDAEERDGNRERRLTTIDQGVTITADLDAGESLIPETESGSIHSSFGHPNRPPR